MKQINDTHEWEPRHIDDVNGERVLTVGEFRNFITNMERDAQILIATEDGRLMNIAIVSEETDETEKTLSLVLRPTNQPNLK
jgi:hypothetical protein